MSADTEQKVTLPDGVLIATCSDCDGRFYHRLAVSYCPYCGSEEVFNRGRAAVDYCSRVARTEQEGTDE